MELLTLIVRNVFRHKLRSFLTILGVATAMLAFCVLKSLVASWYSVAEASSPNRLIVRNKTSLVYMLPIAHRNKIANVEGVTGIGHGMWYGGIYVDKKNFFAQFAVSGMEYLNLYPEFLLTPEEAKRFETRRNTAIAGEALAKRFGWEIGDIIPLQGTIFPGNIELTLGGIYRGARRNVDETAFFFRYDFLNERLRETLPDLADKVGWFVVRIDDADKAAGIAQKVDALFRNSLAETLTETEKAFQMGFLSMMQALVAAIRIISYVVIGIILMVLANTMAMTARERTGEYAVLKTLGFRAPFIYALISGESVVIALLGGAGGILLTFPFARILRSQLSHYFPVFEIAGSTLLLAVGVSALVGVAAAIPPAWRAGRTPIAEGLGHAG